MAFRETQFDEHGDWTGVRFFGHAWLGSGRLISRQKMTGMWERGEPQGPTGVTVVHDRHSCPEAIKPTPADVAAAQRMLGEPVEIPLEFILQSLGDATADGWRGVFSGKLDRSRFVNGDIVLIVEFRDDGHSDDGAQAMEHNARDDDRVGAVFDITLTVQQALSFMRAGGPVAGGAGGGLGRARPHTKLLGAGGHRQVRAARQAKRLKSQNNRRLAAEEAERVIQQRKTSSKVGFWCPKEGCGRWFRFSCWLKVHGASGKCPDGGSNATFRGSSRKHNNVTPVHVSTGDLMKRVIANASKGIVNVPGSPADILIDIGSGIAIGDGRYILIDGTTNFVSPTPPVGIGEK